MADKTNLNYEVRELKLGASFSNNKASQYHTIKYDFKPASVDVNKMATVDVGTNHQVTVTVPHLDGAGVPHTVFKGNQRPYTKECVLIIDRSTGEITLEKLSSNIQVKKTRQETSQKTLPPSAIPGEFTNTTQRSTSRTRVTTNKRAAPNPAQAGPAGAAPGARFNAAGPKPQQPQSMVRSPQRTRTSPPQAAPWSGGGNSTLASLPMIGLDDALGLGGPSAPAPAAAPAPAPAPPQPMHNGYGATAPPRQPERQPYVPERSNHVERIERPERNERPERVDRPERNERPERIERPERSERPERIERQERRPNPVAPMPDLGPQLNVQSAKADDSSSSSSSDSDSDSDSGSDTGAARAAQLNGTVPKPALPSDVLNDDLCLSESGSDSD